MKTLILSTKTGQGHHSASLAVKACLEEKGCEAVIEDILKSSKRNASAPVSALYDNIVMHAPTFFGMLYHAGELISSSKHHSPIYYLNSIYSKRLFAKIVKINPQVIVCPHIFSAQAITRLREKYGLAIPSLGIITDYTWSPFWEETRLDGYVIPAPQLVDEFINKGVPREKLFPLGIPVNRRFKTVNTTAKARLAFGITANQVFVVMGGSMGFGRIIDLAYMLIEKLPDAQVVTVCGKNEQLYHKLTGHKNIIPFKYIDNIDLLMDAADVLITKPGGLSATEAMVKRIPVVFTCPIPGGEVHNAAFLSSIGAAVYAIRPEDAADAAVDLILNPDKCTKMIDAQKKYINKDADRDIAELIIKMAKKSGR